MISEDDLAYMREEQLDWLPSECNIISRTETRDTSGGFTDVDSAVHPSVACRFDLLNSNTSNADAIAVIEAAKQFNVEAYIVTLPYDTVVSVDDKIYFNDIHYRVIRKNTSESVNSALRVYVANMP